jgi:hypothetical protein
MGKFIWSHHRWLYHLQLVHFPIPVASPLAAKFLRLINIFGSLVYLFGTGTIHPSILIHFVVFTATQGAAENCEGIMEYFLTNSNRRRN